MVPRTDLSRVNTARPKVVLSAVKRNKGNAVKASACWVWRPKHKVFFDHGNPQQDLKNNGVIDMDCSRHIRETDPNLQIMKKLEWRILLPLSKFDRKADEGVVVYTSNQHQRFQRSGPNWIFDIDALTNSMNYKPVVARNQSNSNAGTKACDDAGEEEKKDAKELGNEGGNPTE
ncbi:hypothetical protein Tco_0343838 [Tanacetum coccineum]